MSSSSSSWSLPNAAGNGHGGETDVTKIMSGQSAALEDGNASEGELSQSSSTASHDPPDTTEDPDERTQRPALFLRRYWRRVSTQTPAFHCYRDPRTKAYACTLTLNLPPSNTKTYKAPAVYASKRAAINAIADYAMTCGILQEAARSMANSDRLSSSSYPIPTGMSSHRTFAETFSDTATNSVTLLNLAVQKYCVEPPNVVLDFVHNLDDQPQVKGYAHRCQLNIRITPDIAESYTTSASYPSTRQAKEAAAQLALAEGVVMLFKLHNSLTTKICRQLELPIPSNVEDHDTAEEENTAGLLAQLVQQVIGRPDAITTEYTSNRNGTCELFGARLLINLQDTIQSFSMPPLFRSKREAKECCCRLAVKSGIKRDLAARHRLFLASRAALDGVTAVEVAEAVSSNNSGQENARDRLAKAMQAYFHSTEGLIYLFSEASQANSSSGQITKFGCSLTISQPSGENRTYQVNPQYLSKKEAKEAVADLALKSGLFDTLRSSHSGHPNDQIASQSIPHLLSPSETYHTRRNDRAISIPPLNFAEDSASTAPPPYMLEALPPTFCTERSPTLDNSTVRQAVLPSREVRGQDMEQHLPLAHTSQPYLDTLRREIQRRCDHLPKSPLRLQLVRDFDTGQYGGRITLILPNRPILEFTHDPLYGTTSQAEEALATEAIQKGILSVLELEYRSVECNLENPAIVPMNPQTPSAGDDSCDLPEPLSHDTGLSKTTGFHPVSHVHQVCQVLLDSQAPRFDVESVSGQTAGYTSRLVVPTVPPKIYATASSYPSKAAARQAVAEYALASGLVDHLKRHSVNSTMHTLVSATKVPAEQEERVNTVQALTKLSYKEQLIAYCSQSRRPAPCFVSIDASTETQSEVLSSEQSVNLSLQVGEELYAMEVKAGRDTVRAQDKLAKMVLKHLCATDAKAH